MHEELRGFQSHFNLEMSEFIRAARDIAIGYGVFDDIAKAESLAQIAEKNDFNEETLKRICLLLEAAGFLSDRGNHRYEVAKEMFEFVVSDGLCFLGVPGDERIDTPTIQRILNSLTKSSSQGSEVYQNAWIDGDMDDEFAERFLNNMNQHVLAPMLAEVRSGVFSGARTIVDAGGGAASLAIAMAHVTARNAPQVIVFDLPKICEVSKRMTDPLSISFLSYAPGNFFESPWNFKADVFHFSNIFHDWTREKILYLLRNSYRCLEEGGRILIHETLLDHKPAQQIPVRIFHLLIYMNSGGGKLSLEQLTGLLEEAGFNEVRIAHEFEMYTTVEARK